MTTPQFKNMNELVEYLATLEDRVQKLEGENQKLRSIQPTNADGNMLAKAISRALPKSDLFNPAFFKRAFAVWGHFMVANLIIGSIAGAIYFCFVSLLLSSMLGSISSTP